MPRMGRPVKTEPTLQWCFRIPQSLASRLDLLLTDPVTGRINPNVKQVVLTPILQRLWQAVLQDQPTIDVGDVVTQLRSRMEDLG